MTEQEIADVELGNLLAPTADVPDTEHITVSSKNPASAISELELAVLRQSWDARKPAKDGKESGSRVRIPKVFHNKGDLQMWKKRTAADIQRAAFATLGCSTRNAGPGLGWVPAIHEGQQVRTQDPVTGIEGPVFLLYLRTYTRGGQQEAPQPATDASVSA